MRQTALRKSHGKLWMYSIMDVKGEPKYWAWRLLIRNSRIILYIHIDAILYFFAGYTYNVWTYVREAFFQTDLVSYKFFNITNRWYYANINTNFFLKKRHVLVYPGTVCYIVGHNCRDKFQLYEYKHFYIIHNYTIAYFTDAWTKTI